MISLVLSIGQAVLNHRWAKKHNPWSKHTLKLVETLAKTLTSKNAYFNYNKMFFFTSHPYFLATLTFIDKHGNNNSLLTIELFHLPNDLSFVNNLVFVLKKHIV